MLLSLPIIFLFPLLVITPFKCYAIAGMFTPNCSFVDTYATGTVFESNLLQLLSSLSTNAKINGAYNDNSFGSSPNKVYGLIMCLADSSLADCINCLEDATSSSTLTCSGSATATVFYDSCMLSYSRKNFLSVADPYDPDFSLDGEIWDDEDAKRTVMRALENLSAKAPYASEKFSFSNEGVREDTNISALVQCTKDLSPMECQNCISYTMPYVYSYSLNYSFSAVRIIGKNCYIRYSSYFFNVSSFPKSLVPAPPTVESSSGGRSAGII
jgi:Salt stress response/antifungal